MRPYSNLPYKQLLFPPFRKETNVSNKEIPIYYAVNPTVSPFLPLKTHPLNLNVRDRSFRNNHIEFTLVSFFVDT